MELHWTKLLGGMTKKHKRSHSDTPAAAEEGGPSPYKDGDAEIVLDDGKTIRVHAMLLALSSTLS